MRHIFYLTNKKAIILALLFASLLIITSCNPYLISDDLHDIRQNAMELPLINITFDYCGTLLTSIVALIAYAIAFRNRHAHSVYHTERDKFADIRDSSGHIIGDIGRDRYVYDGYVDEETAQYRFFRWRIIIVVFFTASFILSWFFEYKDQGWFFLAVAATTFCLSCIAFKSKFLANIILFWEKIFILLLIFLTIYTFVYIGKA